MIAEEDVHYWVFQVPENGSALEEQGYGDATANLTAKLATDSNAYRGANCSMMAQSSAEL
ncbi:hypothetical protein X726_32365 [Mesorhizobium sp. L103C105A0]|nr:hypothetical protein X726_32365 [Mesorhizobium sp. L103C105A0]